VTVHPTKDPALGARPLRGGHGPRGPGGGAPLLLRFPDILRIRIETLTEKFAIAMGGVRVRRGLHPGLSHQGEPAAPRAGGTHGLGREHGVGLEVGSKPELQAVLALDGALRPPHHLQRLQGRGVPLPGAHGAEAGARGDHRHREDLRGGPAPEGGRRDGVEPTAGIRIKLSSAGAGRWSESAGEKSKFGLSASELMRVVDKLRAAGREDILKLVHFHLGSQIPDVRFIKQAMTEVARYYVELRELGLDITHVDVGGGLGVDYDGSRSTGVGQRELLHPGVRERHRLRPGRGVPGARAPHAPHHLGVGAGPHRPPRPPPGERHRPGDPDRGGPDGDPGRDAHPGPRALRDVQRPSTSAPCGRSTTTRPSPRSRCGPCTTRGAGAPGARLRRAPLPGDHEPGARAGRRGSGGVRGHPPELDAILIDRYFCNFSLFQSLPTPGPSTSSSPSCPSTGWTRSPPGGGPSRT
jgi:hypothetical protein